MNKTQMIYEQRKELNQIYELISKNDLINEDYPDDLPAMIEKLIFDYNNIIQSHINLYNEDIDRIGQLNQELDETKSTLDKITTILTNAINEGFNLEIFNELATILDLDF